MLKKTLILNGEQRRVVADPAHTLLKVLREQLFLTGTKDVRGPAGKAARTVILDGSPTDAGELVMREVPEDARVITIEGVGTAQCLHPLQVTWIINGVAKAGFFSPGLIVRAKALLDQEGNPAPEQVAAAFEGCEGACGAEALDAAVKAVLDAARLMSGTASVEELWLKAKGEPYTPGAELAQREEVAKVTGAARFGCDVGIGLPANTLYARLVCPGVLGARILSIDTASALRTPGVLQVLTASDIPGSNRLGATGKILADRTLSRGNEAVAIVLACHKGLAAEAACEVVAKLEADDSAPDASAPGAVGSGLSGAALPEPTVVFAYLNSKGRLVVQTQKPDINAAAIAAGIGIDPSALVIEALPVASGVDHGTDASAEAAACAAVLVTKQPVFLEL
ncbi:MAG: hypothetical protein LBD25_08415 [Coriobacteriales bacterium]|jgi:aldehyde oxidoreductase|nr:hypothetical protein [Coriobacteriales bacterium]